MEVMAEGEELWSHIEVKAKPDNTFIFERLSNGTGVGDNVNHVVFVMVGGDVPHRIVTRGKQSKKLHFLYKPEGASY